MQFGFLLGYSSFQYQRHLKNGVPLVRGCILRAMSSDDYPKKIAPNSLMESYWFRGFRGPLRPFEAIVQELHMFEVLLLADPIGPFGLDRQRIRIHFDDSRVSGDLQAAELQSCDEK